MHVSSITVEFTRSRQPQPYESATAKVGLTVVFPEDDNSDYVANAAKLLGDCKTLVLQELALVPPGQSGSVSDLKNTAAPAPQAGGKTETAAQKKKREKEEAEKLASQNAPQAQEQTGTPAADEIPDDSTPAAGKAPVHISTAKASDDIPDDKTPATVATPIAGKVNHAELTAYISKSIADKKIDRDSVKAITASFGKERIADVPEASLADYKVKLDAKMGVADGLDGL